MCNFEVFPYFLSGQCAYNSNPISFLHFWIKKNVFTCFGNQWTKFSYTQTFFLHIFTKQSPIFFIFYFFYFLNLFIYFFPSST